MAQRAYIPRGLSDSIESRDNIKIQHGNFTLSKQLTLREIGIPYYDILQITTESGCFYVELTKDEEKYQVVR